MSLSNSVSNQVSWMNTSNITAGDTYTVDGWIVVASAIGSGTPLGGGLTLIANQGIQVNADVTTSNSGTITLTSSAGSITGTGTISADGNLMLLAGGNIGAIGSALNVYDANGSIVITSGGDTTLTSDSTSMTLSTVNVGGALSLTTTTTGGITFQSGATAGSITLTSAGGITNLGGTLTATSGNISLSAQYGIGSSIAPVYLQGTLASNSISDASGDVNIVLNYTGDQTLTQNGGAGINYDTIISSVSSANIALQTIGVMTTGTLTIGGAISSGTVPNVLLGGTQVLGLSNINTLSNTITTPSTNFNLTLATPAGQNMYLLDTASTPAGVYFNWKDVNTAASNATSITFQSGGHLTVAGAIGTNTPIGAPFNLTTASSGNIYLNGGITYGNISTLSTAIQVNLLSTGGNIYGSGMITDLGNTLGAGNGNALNLTAPGTIGTGAFPVNVSLGSTGTISTGNSPFNNNISGPTSSNIIFNYTGAVTLGSNTGNINPLTLVSNNIPNPGTIGFVTDSSSTLTIDSARATFGAYNVLLGGKTIAGLGNNAIQGGITGLTLQYTDTTAHTLNQSSGSDIVYDTVIAAVNGASSLTSIGFVSGRTLTLGSSIDFKSNASNVANVTLSGASDIAQAASTTLTATNANLNLSTAGSIYQGNSGSSTPLSISIGTGTLSISSATNAYISANAALTIGASNTTGIMNIASTAGITLGGNLTSTGSITLTLDPSSSITGTGHLGTTSLSLKYSGAKTLAQTDLTGAVALLTTPGNLTSLAFATTSGDLTIDSTANVDFSGLTTTATNLNVGLTSAAALIGSSQTVLGRGTGTISLTALNGNIASSATPLSVSASGNVILNAGASGNIYITSADALSLGAITTTTGALSLATTAGTMTFANSVSAGSITVSAAGLLTLNSGATLTSTDTLTGLISLTTTSGAMNLGASVLAATSLTATSADALYGSGTLSTTAGDLSLHAAGKISKTSGSTDALIVSVDSTHALVLSTTSNGPAYITSAGALKLGAITTTGLLNIATSANGLTIAGAINTGANNLTLNSAAGIAYSSGGSLTTTGSSDIILTAANGDIGASTPGNALPVSVGRSLIIEGYNGGNLDTTVAGATNAYITSAAALSLGLIKTSGALSLTTTAVGGITLTDTISGSAVTISSFAGITGASAKTITASGDLSLSANGNIQNSDNSALSVSVSGGNLVLTTTGTSSLANITSATALSLGTISTTGALSLTTTGSNTGMAFTNAVGVTSGDITLSSTGNITATSSGVLTATSGDISIDASTHLIGSSGNALNVVVSTGTDYLTILNAGASYISSTAALKLGAITTSGLLNIATSTGSLNIAGAISSGANAMTLTSAAGISYTSGSLTTTSGALSLTAAGDIGATGAGAVLVSVSGGGNLGLNAGASGNIYITSTGDLSLGAINTTSGAIGITSANGISLTQNLSSSGNITLTAASLTPNSKTITATALTLSSGANSMNIANTSGFISPTDLLALISNTGTSTVANLTLSGAGVTVSNAITNTLTGGITFADTSSAGVSFQADVNAGSSALTVTSTSGSIIGTGTLTTTGLLTLTTNTTNGTIGSLVSPLKVDYNTISATSSSTNLALTYSSGVGGYTLTQTDITKANQISGHSVSFITSGGLTIDGNQYTSNTLTFGAYNVILGGSSISFTNAPVLAGGITGLTLQYGSDFSLFQTSGDTAANTSLAATKVYYDSIIGVINPTTSLTSVGFVSTSTTGMLTVGEAINFKGTSNTLTNIPNVTLGGKQLLGLSNTNKLTNKLTNVTNLTLATPAGTAMSVYGQSGSAATGSSAGVFNLNDINAALNSSMPSSYTFQSGKDLTVAEAISSPIPLLGQRWLNDEFWSYFCKRYTKWDCNFECWWKYWSWFKQSLLYRKCHRKHHRHLRRDDFHRIDNKRPFLWCHHCPRCFERNHHYIWGNHLYRQCFSPFRNDFFFWGDHDNRGQNI